MERRVLVEEYQKATQSDFLNFGLFAEQTFDDIGQGLLIPDAAFWGFAVVAQGTNLLVGPGHLINGGVVYYNDDEGGTILDTLPRLPVATRRYLAVVTWGQEVDAAMEPRTFLVDVDTRATEARVVPTERRRRAELSLVSGVEGPDPQWPSLASNVTPVAYVLCDTNGIVSITQATDYLAPSLRSLNTLAKNFDIWRAQIAHLLDTLASDLAALAGRIRGLADLQMVIAIAEQLAQVKDEIGLPDTYSMWGADHYLDEDDSDTADADYLALIEEGIRFPYAQQRDSQIGLLNPIDPNVMVQSQFMLPAYDLTTRVSSVGNDAEVSISSLQYQNITIVKKSVSRSRIRYGTPFKVCTNNSFWDSGEYDPETNIFRRNTGETFLVTWSDDDDRNVDDDDSDDDDRKHKKKKHKKRQEHKQVRLTQFWTDTWTEYYWDSIVTTESVSGSIIGETFLNSQEGWIAGIDIYFTRKGSSGDVRLLVCEADASGAPNYRAVIGDASIDVADIKLWPSATRVLFKPIALNAGKRYCFILVSGGNHYLAQTEGNKYSSGTFFTSSDGAWWSGDLLKDLAFQLLFCRFRAPRVEVQMQPLQLENGIAAIDLNVDCVLPQKGGFDIVHEVQIGGVWKSLNSGMPNMLLGLPAMLPYRIVFLGTTEMMPGVGIGSNSRVLTWRPRSDFKHVSAVRTMPVGVTCETVTVKVRLEAWRGAAHHSCDIKLKYGASYNSLKTAGAVVDQQAPEDANAIIRAATFTFSPGEDDYKVQIEGTTDNVLTTFHVAERIDVALSTS